MPCIGADVKIVVGSPANNFYERALMHQFLNNIEKEIHPKVDFSSYIRTENKPDGDEGTNTPTQPEKPEAE